MSNNRKISIKKILIPNSKIPILNERSILKEALELMSKYKFGVSFCTSKNGKLLGVITDGDVRRKILNIQKPFSALLTDDVKLHMNRKPKKIFVNSSLNIALQIMRKNRVWDLPVVDKNNKLQGMLHLHPIVHFLLKK